MSNKPIPCRSLSSSKVARAKCILQTFVVRTTALAPSSVSSKNTNRCYNFNISKEKKRSALSFCSLSVGHGESSTTKASSFSLRPPKSSSIVVVVLCCREVFYYNVILQAVLSKKMESGYSKVRKLALSTISRTEFSMNLANCELPTKAIFLNSGPENLKRLHFL